MSQILSFSNKHRREVIRHQVLGASVGGSAACCARRVLLPSLLPTVRLLSFSKVSVFFSREEEVNVSPLTHSACSRTGNLDTCVLLLHFVPSRALLCTVDAMFCDVLESFFCPGEQVIRALTNTSLCVHC